MNDPSITFVVTTLISSYASGWAFGHILVTTKKIMESVV